VKKYQNKNVLILGASYGIGEQVAKQLHLLGANLWLVARSSDKLKDLQQQLKQERVSVSHGDVCSLSSLQSLGDVIKQQWQRIDYCIFSSAVYTPMGIETFDNTQAHQMIDVNLKGFFNVIEALLKQQSFTVKKMVVLSSPSGFFGMPNSLAYGASKAGLSNLVQSLACEKLPNTKFQIIYPGFVKTRLTDKNQFPMPFLIDSEQAAQRIVNALPKSKFEVMFPKRLLWVMRLIRLLPTQWQITLLQKLKR